MFYSIEGMLSRLINPTYFQKLTYTYIALPLSPRESDKSSSLFRILFHLISFVPKPELMMVLRNYTFCIFGFDV